MKRFKTWLRLFKVFTSKHPGTNASSIAFYCFMAMIPLLVIFAFLVPARGVSADSLIAFFKEVVPEEMYGLITRVVREAYNHSHMAFSVSIVTLVLVASQFMTSMIYGLNYVYEAQEKRSYPKLLGLSVVYTTVFVLFLSAVVYLIFSHKIFEILKLLIPSIQIPDAVVSMITSLLLALLSLLFFASIYKFLPAGRRTFSDQMPGAVLCSGGWYLFSFLFRVYVDHFNRFTKFYGSLATVALFLFWIYCIFYMLLGGGFVNVHSKELGLDFLKGRRWWKKQKQLEEEQKQLEEEQKQLEEQQEQPEEKPAE